MRGLAVGVAVLVVFGLVLAEIANGQGVPVPYTVIVTTPDGGLPVTLGAQRVAVEATGPAGAPVDVTGAVTSTLTAETITALGPAPCGQGETRRLALTTTPTAVPPDLADGGIGALAGRTEMHLVNVDNTQNISCRPDPGDGGLPDCTTPGFGLTLFPNGGSHVFTARDNVRIRCRSCAGASVPLEYLEEACAH